MIRHDLQLADVKWVDVTSPNKDDLTSLAEELRLPLLPLLTSLDPEHLPKVENYGDATFVILRCIDSGATPKGDSVGELTTKVVLFICPRGVLTIHRLDPPFVEALRQGVRELPHTMSVPNLLKGLVFGAIMSYDEPLSRLDTKAEILEFDVFQGRRSSRLLREGYLLRRHAAVYRRALKFTGDVVEELAARSDSAWSGIDESKERTQRLSYYAEELLDNVTHLLNLHVALLSQKTNEASYRTNEIMRVLTMFSIFFLPLNFIAGIYGMNFDHMPELHWAHGYYLVLGVMIIVSGGIFMYMRRNGWFKPADRK